MDTEPRQRDHSPIIRTAVYITALTAGSYIMTSCHSAEHQALRPEPTSTQPAPEISIPNSSTTLSTSTTDKPATPKPQSIEACIARENLFIQAGQVLMIGLQGADMASQMKTFKNYNIGGAVMMSVPPGYLDKAIIKFRNGGDGLGIPLIISTDQEGGAVERVPLYGLPAPASVPDTETPAQAEAYMAVRAHELKAIGINWILGPLADLTNVPTPNFLGTRTFSSNPTVVTAYDRAYIEGIESAGMLPVIKHFPDMGSANGDTDTQSAQTAPISELGAALTPYANLAYTHTAVMMSNATVPGLTGDVPASLSPAAYEKLVNTLNNDGQNLVITDDLNAAAITDFTPEPNAVVDAINSGADVALVVERPGEYSNAQVADLFALSESAIVEAVKTGVLPPKRLEDAVRMKLKSQNVNPCSVFTGSN